MKKTIFTVIVLVLIFGLGILVGTKMKSKQKQAATSVPAAQDNPAETSTAGVPKLPEGAEIKNVSGTVQAVSGGKITLKLSQFDPFAQESKETLEISTNSDTKFFQFIEKDPAKFQREMADFQKKMLEQKAGENGTVPQPVTPPIPQEKKEISLSDIKEGQMVMVASNDNIRGKSEFTASEISISSMSTNPTPPPAPTPEMPAALTPPAGTPAAPAPAAPAGNPAN